MPKSDADRASPQCLFGITRPRAPSKQESGCAVTCLATIPLPENIDSAEAGPLLCGGITVFNPLAMFAKPTARVGIVGIGGLGHTGEKVAAYGCDVTAFTSSENKFDDARGFGAQHVVSSRDSAAFVGASASCSPFSRSWHGVFTGYFNTKRKATPSLRRS